MTTNSTTAWPSWRLGWRRITVCSGGLAGRARRDGGLGSAQGTREELERGDDVVEQVLDGGAEQAQRDDHGDRDHAEDNGVLGHRLAGLVCDVGLEAVKEV